MALTKEQRTALDTALVALARELAGIGQYSLDDLQIILKNRTNVDYTNGAISKAIERLIVDMDNDISVCRYEWHKVHYSFSIAVATLTGTLRKERNRLYIENTKGLPIYYDFDTDRVVMPDGVSQKQLLDNNHVLRYMSKLPEWVFNYTSHYDATDFCALLSNIDYRHKVFNDGCPKGYIKWLEETNHRISSDTLEQYNMISKYGMIGYNISNQLGTNIMDDIITAFGDKGVDKLLKLITNDIKSGDLEVSRNTIKAFIRNCRALHNLPIFTIDYNRGLKYNYHQIIEMLNSHKKEVLGNQLQRLNPLNGFTVGDYVVVVPQNLTDLQAEGRNQHNCVGSFYNDSIIRGDNLICFVRKVDKPNKSYMTCRYNISCQKLVECRRFSNTCILPSEETIVKAVTAEINRILGVA